MSTSIKEIEHIPTARIISDETEPCGTYSWQYERINELIEACELLINTVPLEKDCITARKYWHLPGIDGNCIICFAKEAIRKLKAPNSIG